MCDGRAPDLEREVHFKRKLDSIIYAVNWVCDDSSDQHVWLSVESVILQEANTLEAMQYDLGIPCVVQWGMLWFSAPTSLNNYLINDGELNIRYYEAIGTTLNNAITIPSWCMNSPRACFLRAIRNVFIGMPGRIWDLGREMNGWELGGEPHLLFDNEYDEFDLDTELEDLFELWGLSAFRRHLRPDRVLLTHYISVSNWKKQQEKDTSTQTCQGEKDMDCAGMWKSAKLETRSGFRRQVVQKSVGQRWLQRRSHSGDHTSSGRNEKPDERTKRNVE